MKMDWLLIKSFYYRLFFSSRRRHTRWNCDWSSDVCSSDLTIPIATIHRIFAEFETLDWRDPGIIGTITFTGNLALANHLAKSCVRPSNWALARFRKAGRQHAALGHRNLTTVEYL